MRIETKTIAVDMDEVLVGLLNAWITLLNQKHSLNVKPEDIVEWDMHKAFPTLTDDELYGVLSSQELWRMVMPLPYAVRYLHKLHQEGHIIKVVTASHYSTISVKLTEALFPYFDFLTYKDVIVCYDKFMIRANILIDDNIEHLKTFDGIRLLMDAPYNRHIDNGYDYRVRNLKEAYDIIHQLKSITPYYEGRRMEYGKS